jgi:rubrerythrin
MKLPPTIEIIDLSSMLLRCRVCGVKFKAAGGLMTCPKCPPNKEPKR